jgi:subtilisin family serine protease
LLSLAAHAQVVPNDAMYAAPAPGQWGIEKVGVPGAWDLGTGLSRVVVASIDSGVDYAHPDLYLNIWINQAEVPNGIWRHILSHADWDSDHDGLLSFWDLNASDAGGGLVFAEYDLDGNNIIDASDLLLSTSQRSAWENGRDAGGDRNSFADDLIGWDFYDGDNDPMDEDDHGTHTAGIIGAVGNNDEGVAGMNWQVQIMPVRFLGPAGGGDLSDGAKAIIYAADSGARLSNNSWGSPEGGRGDVLYKAIEYAAGKNHLVIASAGNDGWNTDYSYYRNYPADYALPNIISVTASNSSDGRPSWANVGVKTVDLAAPGVNILSAVRGGGYAFGTGTSMAAAFVTGTAALMLAMRPALSYGQMKNLILKNVDPVSGFSGRSVTGGRLNVLKALNAAGAAMFSRVRIGAGLGAA